MESLAARAEHPRPPASPPARAAAPPPAPAAACPAEPAGSLGAVAGPAAQEAAAQASAARLAALEAALSRCAAVIGIEVRLDVGGEAHVAAAPGPALGPHDAEAGGAGDGEAGLWVGRAQDQAPSGAAGLTAERLAALEAALAGSPFAIPWSPGAAGIGCGGAPAPVAAAEPELMATAACGRPIRPKPSCRSGGGVGAAPLCIEVAPADGVVYVGCAAPAAEGKPAKRSRVTVGRGLGCGALRIGGRPACGHLQAAGGGPGARASKQGCTCVIS